MTSGPSNHVDGGPIAYAEETTDNHPDLTADPEADAVHCGKPVRDTSTAAGTPRCLTSTTRKSMRVECREIEAGFHLHRIDVHR